MFEPDVKENNMLSLVVFVVLEYYTFKFYTSMSKQHTVYWALGQTGTCNSTFKLIIKVRGT